MIPMELLAALGTYRQDTV